MIISEAGRGTVTGIVVWGTASDRDHGRRQRQLEATQVAGRWDGHGDRPGLIQAFNFAVAVKIVSSKHI